jgi:S-adenosylmethionine synthetase|nr:MAG TPA_asm: S adenosylmethionine synthase [Caudoviricetes sp.]
MSKIITCEQVSNGHLDKICDQIADAIVTDVLKHDKNARVAIECLLKKNQLFIAGEMTTDYQPNYHQLVHNVITRIGAEKMGFDFSDRIRIGVLVDKQSPDIALGVDKGGAGDQGIMYGYATNETAEQMPIPYMVATKFLRLLKNHPSKMFRADAKAQVSYDYDTGRISTFLCSVQHSPDVEVSDFRHIIESMMVLAACEYGLDGDFTKLVNPTGRFVLGGSYADCGVTGRTLACDTYGGIGRMGGGALSGKDPTKVDRSAAYMARKIAKDIVQAGYADKCEVQLALRHWCGSAGGCVGRVLRYGA